jgi:GMP synthase (glutamine-hydrolysing)
MRIHILQHAAFEGPACITDWCHQHQFKLSWSRLYKNEPLPDLHQLDILIILGGPMGVGDTCDYPWLMAEQAFIHRCIAAEKCVLGICLGAQLIASALGATISRNPEKEIGWFEVQRHDAVLHHPFAAILPECFEAFHWHGETFSLPSTAIPLATSVACINQGFIYNNKVLALQFHLEASVDSVRLLINNCRDELIDSPFIQGETAMLEKTERFTQAQRYMVAVLDYLLYQCQR